SSRRSAARGRRPLAGGVAPPRMNRAARPRLIPRNPAAMSNPSRPPAAPELPPTPSPVTGDVKRELPPAVPPLRPPWRVAVWVGLAVLVLYAPTLLSPILLGDD